MQLIEHSMDNLNVSMILFPIRTILDGEIIPTYIMGTRLNKAIKANSPMDFSPNRIIKRDKMSCLNRKQGPAFINSHVIGSSSDDLHEKMKTLASNIVTLQQNVMSFQQETRSSIHNLEKQMGQVASSVGKLEAQMNGKLPSQALNPKEIVSVITLRSGKKLEEQRSKQIKMEEEEIETELSINKKILFLHKLKK
jgi:hypothetical protein